MNMRQRKKLNNREYLTLIGAMSFAVLLSLYCFVLVFGGIGGFIEKIGKNNVPGWDNWFCDVCIWLSAYTPPLNGVPYFVATISVLTVVVIIDLYVTVIGRELVEGNKKQ
jgi:hypothetical protein